MKSFATFCENRTNEAKLHNWLANEYEQDTEAFEAFLFFHEREAVEQLNELNLLSKMGRMFGGGEKPTATPTLKPGQPNLTDFKSKQEFQRAMRDWRAVYPTGDTHWEKLQRQELLNNPRRLQSLMPKLDKVIDMSNNLGFTQGVDRWTKLKNYINQKTGQAAQPIQNKAPGEQPIPLAKTPAVGVGVSRPQDTGFNVQQAVQQAVLSSKIVSDTLNKIIAHPHIRQYFQGEKAPILQNMVQAWKDFKKEVQVMQQDPKFPAPNRANQMAPLTAQPMNRGPGRV